MTPFDIMVPIAAVAGVAFPIVRWTDPELHRHAGE